METADTKPEMTGEEPEWLTVAVSTEARLTRKQAELFALVLESQAIPCSIRHGEGRWLLTVPEHCLETAQQQLRIYCEKNVNWPPPPPASRSVFENTLPTVSVLILLATFHNLTLLGTALPETGYIDLQELGLAHAAAILDGQWWRLVTALTLHANLTHLAGNLLIGGTFVILLCRELGSGLAWSLLLGTGMFGNLLNALMQSTDHRSVGASTAVFGAVGIFSALSAMRYRRHLLRKWFIPVAAGLSLLALLGTEGKQTDLGAHLFGFASGIMAGIVTELLVSRLGRPAPLLNALLALASSAAVIGAWWLAVEYGR